MTVNFHIVTDLKDKASAGTAAKLETITFLWASANGLDKLVGSATIYEISGAIVTIDKPFYDFTTDTLTVRL